MTPRDGADEPTPDGETAEPEVGEPEAEADAELDTETAPDTDAEPDWVRRRRLDAVFGDGAHGQALGDRWYQEQVPPHHG